MVLQETISKGKKIRKVITELANILYEDQVFCFRTARCKILWNLIIIIEGWIQPLRTLLIAIVIVQAVIVKVQPPAKNKEKGKAWKEYRKERKKKILELKLQIAWAERTDKELKVKYIKTRNENDNSHTPIVAAGVHYPL